MIVIEGASMAHVTFEAFWALWSLVLLRPAVRAFQFARSLLGGR